MTDISQEQTYDKLLENCKQLIYDRLLEKYDKFMLLKVFLDSDDKKLAQKYIASSETHNSKTLVSLENDDILKQHIDAGFDLFVPCDIDSCVKDEKEKEKKDTNNQFKIDHKIVCSAVMFTGSGKCFNTGYYLYPRSSISKTDIRLANSVGIIDSGYRGHLIGVFDYHSNNNSSDSTQTRRIVNAYDRVLQVCAPGLVPVLVELVDNVESLGMTERGNKGFGSSGK